MWLRLQFTCTRCGWEQWQENGHSVQSSRRVRATPLKKRSEPRGVWLMRFVWFLLQVVSTDTLAVGSSRAIDSLAPVAKHKRDQITSFSTLASSQQLGRYVTERSRFDRFQLSVWFGIVGNNIVLGESGRLLSWPTWVCCAADLISLLVSVDVKQHLTFLVDSFMKSLREEIHFSHFSCTIHSWRVCA